MYGMLHAAGRRPVHAVRRGRLALSLVSTLAVLVVFGAHAEGSASPRAARLTATIVARGLQEPVYVTAPRSQPRRLYVVERPGRVLILEGRRLLATPFLDIRGDVSAVLENGLHSIAFHPRYPTDPRVFVDYNDRSGDIRVVEYRAAANAVIPASRRELLFVDKPEGVAWHNGGQLQFGRDGRLYVSLGDSARNPLDPLPDPHPSIADPTNNAQNLDVLFGKLFTLDVDSPAPEAEIVGYGLRNAWRFSFDRKNGDLYIGDVGQHVVEEVDYVKASSRPLWNFGWSVWEGRRRYKPGGLEGPAQVVWPIHTYRHESFTYCRGRGTVIGGYVYRGRRMAPMVGRYVYGDFCTGEIWSFLNRGGRASANRAEPARVPRLTSFGESASGELYATSFAGRLYRFEVPSRSRSAESGASRARTGDLVHAEHALSQLSYGPRRAVSLAANS
jgi:glucose/arabinose dehydrogenase